MFHNYFNITKYIVSYFIGKETLENYMSKKSLRLSLSSKECPILNTEESFELISKDSVLHTIFLQSHAYYLTIKTFHLDKDRQIGLKHGRILAKEGNLLA